MTQPAVSFAIGIPTINQWPTLKKYISMYFLDCPGIKIFIIDNGQQKCDLSEPTPDANILLFHETKNIGVAASWNKLCQEIYNNGHTHAMIINDDVYPGRTRGHIESILHFPRDLYKTSRDDWSLFILPQTTFKKVGAFDTEFYPAYFEDRDYAYRMKLKGCSVMASIKFDPMIYKESQSSKKDPSLLDNFDRNEKLYIDKWGGKPGFETYRIPYNGKKETP